MGAMSKPHAVGVKDLKFVDSYSVLSGEEGPLDSAKVSTTLSESADLPTITNMDVIPDDPTSVSDSLDVDTGSISSLKTNIEDNFAGINEAINSSVSKGEGALKNSLDTITLSVTSAFKGANEAVESAVNKVLSAVDQAGELAGKRLTGISNDSREASNRVGILAVDLLRGTIVAAEDSLLRGATFVVYAYGSVKKLLPSEFQSVLDISEERAMNFLRPVPAAFQQVYISLEGLERSLGLEPSDPVVPFVVFLGTSGLFWYGRSLLCGIHPPAPHIPTTFPPNTLEKINVLSDLCRASYWVLTYSGYAGNLPPKVDGSVRKLLKSGKGLDETLIAAVIRNLKVVQDRSEVIVMDADGTRSKGIARSLRKLGRPYLVQGGFRSWVKEGLRIKELRTETTLTILNEDVEAILEEVKPTPLKVLGYGVGFIAAAYALSVKESSLARMISSLKDGSADTKNGKRRCNLLVLLASVWKFSVSFFKSICCVIFFVLIAWSVATLYQTIYLRVASYKDSEDLKQDVRLLLVPAKLGGQAISWAAGKLETNRIGLPTSPSSSDVQSRVLQAAAKHESQPSDSEETPDRPSEPTAPIRENVDLSEA
ncbi:hypothetical protein RJ640_026714 [Escallonia rubra]|uniref:Rhodanese domain-containing protein n=1 Tax=Escallonia rubra TaxID=112253 RepID=A0AA88QWP2_9ASTE|nr:hypothetical protein RJ640_026714 [Escallonia rubra]